MKTLVTLAVLFSLAKPASFKMDDAAKKDIETLQGRWQLIAMAQSGREWTRQDIARHPNLIIKGLNRVDADGGNPSRLVAINATAKPKTFDWEFIDAPGKVERGIYQFRTTDFLQENIAGPGKDRPADFGSARGTSNALAIYKRVK